MKVVASACIDTRRHRREVAPVHHVEAGARELDKPVAVVLLEGQGHSLEQHARESVLGLMAGWVATCLAGEGPANAAEAEALVVELMP